MSGSTPFSIEASDNFNRSFKKFAKIHGASFVEIISKVLEELIDYQYPNNSRNEPLPGKIKLPEEWTFHKIDFRIAKGASGQIRLMYLVNATTCIIKLVWIYSHEQFSKRPADADLKSVLREILEF
jgi:mRNA-degrading endonuclease YafQ of YafQ-DinJ toxin-antitoxin module